MIREKLSRQTGRYVFTDGSSVAGFATPRELMKSDGSLLFAESEHPDPAVRLAPGHGGLPLDAEQFPSFASSQAKLWELAEEDEEDEAFDVSYPDGRPPDDDLQWDLEAPQEVRAALRLRTRMNNIE